MERDPLTVTADFLLADISEQIKEIHYGAAVVVDARAQAGRADHALRSGRARRGAG